MCVSDGYGPYGDNEYCQMRVEQSMTITSTEFATEYGYDFIWIYDSTQYASYHGSSLTDGPRNVQVAAGTIMTWSTDGSDVALGFTICAVANAPSSDTSANSTGQPPHPPADSRPAGCRPSR